MVWGTFTVQHIISLAAIILFAVSLYFILKRIPDGAKTAVLFAVSLFGAAAVVYDLVHWGQPLLYLPLHLCSLNAMALPIAVISKNKVLNNLLLLWSVGALFALVLNTSVSETEIFGWVFVFYFFPHVLELGIPILMFALGLVKKDARCIFSTVGITVSSYTVIHFINLFINSYARKNGILNSAGDILSVNYMFSIAPENPLLDLFYSIIPHSYWYMYLCFIIVIIYLLLVYARQITAMIKAKGS